MKPDGTDSEAEEDLEQSDQAEAQGPFSLQEAGTDPVGPETEVMGESAPLPELSSKRHEARFSQGMETRSFGPRIYKTGKHGL